MAATNGTTSNTCKSMSLRNGTRIGFLLLLLLLSQLATVSHASQGKRKAEESWGETTLTGTVPGLAVAGDTSSGRRAKWQVVFVCSPRFTKLVYLMSINLISTKNMSTNFAILIYTYFLTQIGTGFTLTIAITWPLSTYG